MSYVSEALERKVLTLLELQERYRAFQHSPIRRIEARLSVPEMEQWRTDMAVLAKADSFYWNTRTTQLITQAAADFDLDQITASRNLLYCDYGWHYFGGEKAPMELVVPSGNTFRGEARPLRAILWYWFAQKGEALGATAYVEEKGSLYPAMWVSIDAGAPMSQATAGAADFVGETGEQTLREMLQMKRLLCCMTTFVRQEILSAAPQQAERHARRRLERMVRAKLGPKLLQVHEIQLRRASLSGTKHPTSTEEVSWNWQWTVRGHTRKQWYPSLQEHLPVYIHGYLKGPEDKPLKPRTTPIYAVTR